MLVLARKVGESIRIGDDVVLTVQHIGRGRVQLGIDAPRQVVIRREELAALEHDWACSLGLSGPPASLDAFEAAVG